ncbi:MAG TPA: hypothetical protein VJ183_16745 [Chloroflexia bacterium]|nr:hypothetical protein [Chloroflexia bacterium]
MQAFLIDFHSIFRWVVLLTAIGALALSILAASGSRPWDAVTDRFSLFFTIAMDVQLLVGLGLWVVEQRWTINDTFLAWLHPMLMIAAVGLAHVGRVRADRVEGDRQRGTQAALFFGASLVVVILAIPLSSWPI